MNAHASRSHVHRCSRWSRLALLVGAMGAVAFTSPAHAQFGALKKLKDKVTGTPDSTKTDSTKAGTDTTKPKGQSIFSKAASMAGAASDKLEATTGISAKDAALAATGAGAANLINKKLTGAAGDGSGMANAVGKALSGGGVNPAQSASGAAQSALQQLGADKLTGGKTPPSMASGLAGLLPGGAGASMPRLPAGVPGMAEGATPDAKETIAFQQELMQVAMKASTGDAAASARLEAWQTLLVRYQPEITKLQQGMVDGDATMIRKMQDLQLKIMREWRTGSTIKPKKP